MEGIVRRDLYASLPHLDGHVQETAFLHHLLLRRQELIGAHGHGAFLTPPAKGLALLLDRETPDLDQRLSRTLTRRKI